MLYIFVCNVLIDPDSKIERKYIKHPRRRKIGHINPRYRAENMRPQQFQVL